MVVFKVLVTFFLSVAVQQAIAFRFSLPGDVRSVICEGEEVQCPDQTTCCHTQSGVIGCCPIPNAICCDDGVHCCSEGTVCSEELQACIQKDMAMPWYGKVPAKPLSNGRLIKNAPTISLELPSHEVTVDVNNVICPDQQSQCPDGTTCCKLSSGQYGCCPLPNAVCCSDHVHCCPRATTCDLSKGTCDRQDRNLSIPWFSKFPSHPTTNPPSHEVTVEVNNVICPDQQSQCPDGTTCCKLSSGQYGCCPLPNAVCCSDHVHCCPRATTCDLSKGTCDRGLLSIPWLDKEPSIPVLRDVVCPDGQSKCPTNNTCCKLSSGQWGCCPLPSAVCCADHLHCCPTGTTCDTSHGRCNRRDGTYETWARKTEARL